MIKRGNSCNILIKDVPFQDPGICKPEQQTLLLGSHYFQKFFILEGIIAEKSNILDKDFFAFFYAEFNFDPVGQGIGEFRGYFGIIKPFGFIE